VTGILESIRITGITYSWFLVCRKALRFLSSNRKKWDDYEVAADDMFRFTHRPSAPWVLVGANDKDHARVTVLKTIIEQLERAL
jgi:Polyphosphate kinase 2 (PPK2)